MPSQVQLIINYWRPDSQCRKDNDSLVAKFAKNLGFSLKLLRIRNSPDFRYDYPCGIRLVSQHSLPCTTNFAIRAIAKHNITFGDGYTAGEIATTYAGHVSSMMTTLLGSASSPLSRYASYFNVHRVNVVSNQSGADIPQMGITRDTALNATYRYDGVTDRLLYFNAGLANNAASNALAGTGIDVDMRTSLKCSTVCSPPPLAKPRYPPTVN